MIYQFTFEVLIELIIGITGFSSTPNAIVPEKIAPVNHSAFSNPDYLKILLKKVSRNLCLVYFDLRCSKMELEVTNLSKLFIQYHINEIR